MNSWEYLGIARLHDVPWVSNRTWHHCQWEPANFRGNIGSFTICLGPPLRIKLHYLCMKFWTAASMWWFVFVVRGYSWNSCYMLLSCICLLQRKVLNHNHPVRNKKIICFNFCWFFVIISFDDSSEKNMFLFLTVIVLYPKDETIILKKKNTT